MTDFIPGVGDVVDAIFGDDGSSGGGGGGGGGSTQVNITEPPSYAPGPNLTPGLVNASSSPSLFDFSPEMSDQDMSNTSGSGPAFRFADGGYVEGDHEPQFFSEGGLENYYVKGDGDGTSDSVPAMLATGEFVIPADVVSSLGNGDSDSGSTVLDEFLKTIRSHKQDHAPDELPPDSEGPLAYLSMAMGGENS